MADHLPMFDLLYEHITKKIALTPEEWDAAKPFFVPKQLRKKQFFLQAGEVCENTVFVTQGCLRSYTIDSKGQEHMAQFATEGWWISDMSSLITGEPSVFNIDALEDTEVLMLSKTSREFLFKEVPRFERFFRMLLEASYVALHKRIISSMSLTAEEKYLQMQRAYPFIFQRIPQHMIASYLGLKPETISRIRKKLSDHK